MNLQAYFQKIRDVESKIMDDIVMVASLATDDGGIEGILTEVTRAAAAKLIVEGRSRLASKEEAEAHRAKIEAAHRKIAEDQAAQRLQVAILSDRQVEQFRRSNRKKG
jgi:hypothetical protein